MQLDEARERARQAARDSEHPWFVVQIGDDYRVVSQPEFNKLPGHANMVVYAASPGKQTDSDSSTTAQAP